MTRLLVIGCIAVFAFLAASRAVFTRLDDARASANNAVAYVKLQRAELTYDRQVVRVVALELSKVHGELALCRRRTSGLRGVLEVLIQSSTTWPQRKRLPVIDGWDWAEVRGVDGDAR